MGRDGEDDAQQHDQQAGQDHTNDSADGQAQPTDGGGFGEQEAPQVTKIGPQRTHGAEFPLAFVDHRQQEDRQSQRGDQYSVNQFHRAQSAQIERGQGTGFGLDHVFGSLDTDGHNVLVLRRQRGGNLGNSGRSSVGFEQEIVHARVARVARHEVPVEDEVRVLIRSREVNEQPNRLRFHVRVLLGGAVVQAQQDGVADQNVVLFSLLDRDDDAVGRVGEGIQHLLGGAGGVIGGVVTHGCQSFGGVAVDEETVGQVGGLAEGCHVDAVDGVLLGADQRLRVTRHGGDVLHTGDLQLGGKIGSLRGVEGGRDAQVRADDVLRVRVVSHGYRFSGRVTSLRRRRA